MTVLAFHQMFMNLSRCPVVVCQNTEVRPFQLHYLQKTQKFKTVNHAVGSQFIHAF